jgi:hypothetical protein
VHLIQDSFELLVQLVVFGAPPQNHVQENKSNEHVHQGVDDKEVSNYCEFFKFYHTLKGNIPELQAVDDEDSSEVSLCPNEEDAVHLLYDLHEVEHLLDIPRTILVQLGQHTLDVVSCCKVGVQHAENLLFAEKLKIEHYDEEKGQLEVGHKQHHRRHEL